MIMIRMSNIFEFLTPIYIALQMPCYKCGKTFNEPTEICTGCGIHLVKKGMICSDRIERLKECSINKDCKGCDVCTIIYKGCGTPCRIAEPPRIDHYNYPNCYCACTYTELSNRIGGKKPTKPNPYYAICHACCPIYDMCCYTSAHRYGPNADMSVVGYQCHRPPSHALEFRYDVMYEELLARDTSYNRDDKNSKSVFHHRVAHKAWVQKDMEWQAKRAQERADRRSEEMSRGITSYDGNDYNTYKRVNNSIDNNQAKPTRSAVDFGVLRSK